MKSALNNKYLLGQHLNGKRILGMGDKNKLIFQEIYKLATGTDITLTDTKDDVGRITGVEFASVQNGIPSPDSPIPILNTGDGGILNVWSHRKNMFKTTATDKTILGVTLDFQSNGTVILNGTATGNANCYFSNNGNAEYYEIKPNTQYYLKSSLLSGTATNKNTICYLYDKNKVFKSVISLESDTLAIPVSSETQYISYIQVYITSGNVYNNAVIGIQLEQGTVATPYEPYTGADYPITLPVGYVGGSLPNGVKDTDTMQYMKSITFSGQSVTIPDMKSNGSFRSTRGGTLVDKTITLASVPSGTTTIDYELETPIPITLALPLISTYDKYTKIECLNAVKPSLTVEYFEK